MISSVAGCWFRKGGIKQDEITNAGEKVKLHLFSGVLCTGMLRKSAALQRILPDGKETAFFTVLKFLQFSQSFHPL